jgi:oligopeptide transport system substrate-binding protein
MWQDVLGIEVGLDKKEWKYFLATREDRSAWQVMRFAWIGDYNDPGTFTDIFRSDSQQNLPGYSIPEYDRLLNEANNLVDLDDRAAKYAAAESLLLHDYPIAPLYFRGASH